MEKWVDIKGFEGLYQVSNKMRVKSLDRIVVYNNGKICKFKGKILSTFKNGEYKGVHLWKNNKGYGKLVHHLVADAFIPNPENKPFIDHIIPLSNGGKDELDNLRWCTQKENMNNENTTTNLIKAFTGRKLTDEHKKKISDALKRNTSICKKVYQYTLNNELVNIYPSAKYVENTLGFSNSAISGCCNKKRKTYKGYKWSHEPL